MHSGAKVEAELACDSLRLVLVRHGQTQANIDRVLDMALPGGGLTDLGRRQASLLGAQLAARAEGSVTAVFSSVARRALETASILADHLGVVAQVLDGVHEVQVGYLEGQRGAESMAVMSAIYHRWARGELDVAIEGGGESGLDLIARFSAVIGRVCAIFPENATLILITHGIALRIVARYLVNNAGTPSAEDDYIDNCGRVVLQRSGESWRLVRWLRSTGS